MGARSRRYDVHPIPSIVITSRTITTTCGTPEHTPRPAPTSSLPAPPPHSSLSTDASACASAALSLSASCVHTNALGQQMELLSLRSILTVRLRTRLKAATSAGVLAVPEDTAALMRSDSALRIWRWEEAP